MGLALALLGVLATGPAAAGHPGATYPSRVAAGAPRAAAGGGSGMSLIASGSPFSPDGYGVHDHAILDVQLDVQATLTVTVRDFDGAAVLRLASSVAYEPGTYRWTWDGRNASSALVADGPYRFQVQAVTTSGSLVGEKPIAKSPWAIYAPAPRSIVVALNPGHGAPDPGAVYGGRHESDMNLDIALRLKAMLEATGVTVVMTRTIDRSVLRPLSDRNGDGRVNHDDELIARNDIANLARPDLYVTLMNNAYGCHCARGTETYTSDERSWTPEGVQLARFIQAAHLARLKAFKRADWHPIDRGIRMWHFSSMRPYQPGVMVRPTLMPSVLVESLFMDHPNELRTLAMRPVRTALAAAYFDGIARWLATRPYGLRYEVTAATDVAPAGGTAEVRLHLTNRGTLASTGWVVQARLVRRVPFYDGSPRRGTLLAERSIPDGLAPGAETDVTLSGIPLPPKVGRWLIKLDVRLPSGGTLGEHGVVGPQLPLTTVAATGSPPPEPTPSPGADASPGAQPAPAPGGAVTSAAWSSWRNLLPRDVLAGVPGPGASPPWSASAPWRRWVARRLDIARIGLLST